MTTLIESLKAAITTQLQDGNPSADPLLRPLALDYDEAKRKREAGELPYIHVLITLTRRFGGNQRTSGRRTVTGWRLTTTAVGTTVDEARSAADRVARLEYTRPTADGLDCSALQFESSAPPEPDDGAYSGTTFWTFTSTPTN